MGTFSKYFDIKELVDPQTYEKFGEKSKWFIDDRAAHDLDYLRELLGVPLIINDWHRGGNYQWSGLRTAGSPYHRTYSQHSYGKAFDIKSPDLSANEIYDILMANQYAIVKDTSFTTLENIKATTSTNKYGGWVHIDMRYNDQEFFLVVNP